MKTLGGEPTDDDDVRAQAAALAHAMRQLEDLHDETGVFDVIACGAAAVTPLRAVLFRREPSGLFEVRCRAAWVLAMLHAWEVLFEFLTAPPHAASQIERVGDDAVIDAAARAVGRLRTERVFRLLLSLGSRPHLTQVIEALADFERMEAIPVLIRALEDDGSRSIAEEALAKFGATAGSALVAAAVARGPEPGGESAESTSRRRSALRLLLNVGITGEDWQRLRAALEDSDHRIAVSACALALAAGPEIDRLAAKRRLAMLRPKADILLGQDIDEVLSRYSESGGHPRDPT